MPSVAANGAGGDFTVHVTSIRVLAQMALSSHSTWSRCPSLIISNAKCMLTRAVCCLNETNGHPVVGVACRHTQPEVPNLYVSWVYSSGRSPSRPERLRVS